MNKPLLKIAVGALLVLAFVVTEIQAGGISVDAGLTPGQDRWIFRTQMRYMERGDDPTAMGREMKMYAFPAVLAYGLTSDFTIMARQMIMRREMTSTMMTERQTGLGDFFVMAKYKAYRLNTSSYTIGVAPSLGLEIPSGEDAFTSDSWDLYTGIFMSLRNGPRAMDLNLAWKWNDFTGKETDGIDPGDELSLNGAIAYQFNIGDNARSAVAPVLELSYEKIGADQADGQNVADTGESVLFLSPGLKYSMSFLIAEALLQVPVYQNREGSQLERESVLILGLRLLF